MKDQFFISKILPSACLLTFFAFSGTACRAMDDGKPAPISYAPGSGTADVVGKLAAKEARKQLNELRDFVECSFSKLVEENKEMKDKLIEEFVSMSQRRCVWAELQPQFESVVENYFNRDDAGINNSVKRLNEQMQRIDEGELTLMQIFRLYSDALNRIVSENV